MAGKKIVLWLLGLSLAAGAAMAYWLVRGGSFWIGWASSTGLLFGGSVLLYWLWEKAGSGRLLAWMVALAFILRLGSGLTLSMIVPVYGNNSPEEKAGSIYSDAQSRDQAAWDLAKSSTPILASFQQDFVSDQYGGLLALSAAVYRYLSPDVHRPYLIQILAALAAAAGVPFFWAAVKKRWNEKVARLATWLLVLYPESILLGSSQMREPFLISLAAIAFWAVITWPTRKVQTAVVFAGSLIGLALFSSPIAVPVGCLCLAWLLLDNVQSTQSRAFKGLTWAGLALIFLSLMAFTYQFVWSSYRAGFEINTTILNSGVLGDYLAKFFSGGRQSLVLHVIVVAYGIAQPVLPAALIDPGSKLVYQVIGILRASGWYLMAPLLIYGLVAIWKTPAGKDRRAMIFLVLVVYAWTVISSLRAGGDQWDNPRYRAIFLPWFVLLVGLAWEQAQKFHDPWLWRIAAVELVFVLVFCEWYLSRNYRIFARPSFVQMAIIIGSLSFLILAGGLAWDLVRSRKLSAANKK